jgi:hypothetical protein
VRSRLCFIRVTTRKNAPLCCGIAQTCILRFLLGFAVQSIQIYRQEVGVARREKIIETMHGYLYKVLAFHDLVFMPFTIRIIEVLTCRTIPGGSSYMLSTPSVDCNAGIYHSSFVPLAIFSALWYICLYLIAYGCVFWHCRIHVEDNVYAASYGRWWVRYKPKYYWWQLVFTARKFALALCIGLLPERPIYQMISSMSVWILIMMMHFYVRPYRSKFMDRLDDILLVLMLSIFIACAHFKLEQDNESSGSSMLKSDSVSDTDRFSFFVLGTMATTACFLAYFVGREVCHEARLYSSYSFSHLHYSGFAGNLPTEITNKRRIFERRATWCPNSRSIENH